MRNQTVKEIKEEYKYTHADLLKYYVYNKLIDDFSKQDIIKQLENMKTLFLFWESIEKTNIYTKNKVMNWHREHHLYDGYEGD